MERSQFSGMAVICDPLGRVRKVLRNELCRSLKLESGTPLTSVIDPDSIQKFFTFLYRLREEQALYDWSINVVCNDSVLELFFVGGVNEDEILIVASTSKKNAGTYFTELVQMNNEQTNIIRSTMKQNIEGGGAPKRDDNEDLFHDFSRLNNELADLQRDLHKKNRKLEKTIQERDKYIGVVAHDFRNPLSGFSGMCGFLLDEDLGELTEEQKEVLALMKENSEHLLQMVNDMLDLSSIKTGTLSLNLETADLLQVVKSCVDINRQISRKKNILIELNSEGSSLPVSMDRVKIKQVLDNLLSNAIKFSHPGTVIHVKLKYLGESVELEVADQGQGIPEEEMPKLFKPYSNINVHSTGGEKSTGLGLAISRRIVEGHGGSLTAESTPGEGTVFRVVLPLERSE
ncbi:MAG: HAMP domain-containing sensor histidine kinase [Spirochaetia bacterium]